MRGVSSPSKNRTYASLSIDMISQDLWLARWRQLSIIIHHHTWPVEQTVLSAHVTLGITNGHGSAAQFVTFLQEGQQ